MLPDDSYIVYIYIEFNIYIHPIIYLFMSNNSNREKLYEAGIYRLFLLEPFFFFFSRFFCIWLSALILLSTNFTLPLPLPLVAILPPLDLLETAYTLLLFCLLLPSFMALEIAFSF